MAELQRIGLLAELPGETLVRLAQRMRREQVPAGGAVVEEGDDGDRFYVVLTGMFTVSQSSLGPRGSYGPATTSARSPWRWTCTPHGICARPDAGNGR